MKTEWLVTSLGKILFAELEERDFSLADTAAWHKIPSEKRRMEKWGVHELLSQVFPEGFSMAYTDIGRPYLKGYPGHISISHSGRYIAIAFSDNPVGVDVQCRVGKIERLQSRFIRSDEVVGKDERVSMDALLLHWSAKEAAYKCLGRTGVDFLKHLQVEPFELASCGEFRVCEYKTEAKQRLQAFYWVLSDAALVMVGV